MANKCKLYLFGFLVLISTPSLSQSPVSSPTDYSPQALGGYVVLGWNDLGMHCMNQYFQTLCILPPYNNLWAQVVRRGDLPQVVSQGVTLNYRFPKNTKSSTKVNFWDYEDKLFQTTLAADVGLAGNGLAGAMAWNGQAFEAKGVPLTPFEDAAPTVEQPYQTAEITLLQTSDGQQLDQTQFVAPVSVEINCLKCHGSEDNILKQHEDMNLTSLKPVLCASCHESNALGTPKKPGIPSLSQAVHGKHAEEVANISCYDCHPGQKTQCLRDVMYAVGKKCTDCHGRLANVAQSIENGRRPWLDEPTCETCHGAKYAVNPGKLYRQSTGHGGLFCEACHNSPHAILPSTQPLDNMQAIRLQGYARSITDCNVCHLTTPKAAGPHGLMAPSVAIGNWSVF